MDSVLNPFSPGAGADIEVGLDFEPELGLADNGDLEHDLQALIESVGSAAQAAGTVRAVQSASARLRGTPIRSVFLNS